MPCTCNWLQKGGTFLGFSWPADNTIPCVIFHMLLSEAFIAEVLAPQFTFRAVHCT